MKLPIPSLKIATGCLLAAAMVTVAHSAATLTAGGANGNSPNPGGYDDHQNMMDQLGITQSASRQERQQPDLEGLDAGRVDHERRHQGDERRAMARPPGGNPRGF